MGVVTFGSGATLGNIAAELKQLLVAGLSTDGYGSVFESYPEDRSVGPVPGAKIHFIFHKWMPSSTRMSSESNFKRFVYARRHGLKSGGRGHRFRALMLL